MAFIRLNPSASITQTAAGVLLRSDLGTFQLEGRDVQTFVTAMAPLLDGSRDKEAIAEALSDYSHQSVLSFLAMLEQHGLVEAVSDAPPDLESERWYGQREFFRKWSEQPDECMQRLRQARVLIVGLETWGGIAAAELAASGVGTLHLLDSGTIRQEDLLAVRRWDRRHLGQQRRAAWLNVLAEEAPWSSVTAGPLEVSSERTLALESTDWDLILGTTSGDDLICLQSLARFAHQAGAPSLFGYIEGLSAVVGPGVVPGQTACWNCCRLRQLANMDHPEASHALQASLLAERSGPRAHTYLAPMAATLGHLLALEAVKLISKYTSSNLTGRLLIQNLITLESSLHTVVRMPWCDVCGGAGSTGGGNNTNPAETRKGMQVSDEILPAALNTADSPEALRKMLAGWVDERTGIINQLVMAMPQATDPELPLAATAVLGSYTEGVYQPDQPIMGSGKGLTKVDAMIGAVGEAIERYSASRFRVGDMKRAAMRELSGEALDPRRLCLYNDTQYAEADFPFARYHPEQPIDWTRGRWLDSNEPVWAPALPTYFNYPVSPPERFCQVSSNGLAAGADLEDAALRAVYELVERDAFMLSWLARRPGRRLILDDTLEPEVREVIRQLEGKGAKIELYLLDVGLSLPTVVCVGYGDGKWWPGATVALAAHFSPRVAVRKAVLEQGHAGAYICRMMLEGKQPIPQNPEEVRTLEDHALFYAPVERVHAFDFLRFGGDALSLSALEEPEADPMPWCVEKLAAGGVRIAIVDVTSPDVATGPFRVARALGTDVQPIDFGFKLRRLGSPRLKAMLTDGVNSYPHPLA